MEFWSHLGLGFSIALTPKNLLFCFIGAFLGTSLGALPGVGAIMGVALLIPLTFGMDPVTAMIMLAGIYYGGQYGGAISAILLNIPGDAPAIMTTLDGHPLAKQGRAGPALAVAALSSFTAGTLSVVALSLVAKPLVNFALNFGPPEYFGLILASLVSLSGVFGESVLKGLMMVAMGIMVGTFGMDPVSGAERLTFGSVDMMNGFSFIPVALGIFVIPEVIRNLTQARTGGPFRPSIGRILPTAQDVKRCRFTALRGSALGFIVGALPGAGTTLAAVLSYTMEKKLSRDAGRFGKGEIRGVCAAETANNAASGGAFVPLLALGIPGSPVTAILLGAFMMFGLRPGPMLIKSNPDLVWGLICSMYIGNVILVLLNLPLIKLWVKIIQVPYYILAGIILVCSTAACYAANGNIFDLYVMIGFGILGWLLTLLEFPLAPLLLGLILGPMLEYNLRNSLIISNGDPSIFLTRPISFFFLLYTFVAVALPLIRAAILRSRRSP